MLIRLASALVLVSQLIVLALVFGFSGATSILFSFVGHPLLAAGLLLIAFVVLSRRQIMVRGAALLILVSQLLLLALVFDFMATTSILYFFVGHPALIAGLGLTAVLVYTLRGSQET